MTERLQVIPCEGIRPDSLGGYLAGLGLLAALTNEWSDVRGCWRDGRFCILGREISTEAIESYLLNKWQPQKYERWWQDAQKRDTKAKSDREIWRERSQRNDLREVILLDAHIIGSGRNQFNPVLGTGGNIGKRNLAKVFEAAHSAIKPQGARGSHTVSPLDALRHTLWGTNAPKLPELPAGTWFAFANKTFNSSQDWYKEGKLSPWSYLLAAEGIRLLTGNVNRRLSAIARPYAAFPFVSEHPSPTSPGEVGLARAEFWAPLWERPATLAEIRALLERGLARVGNRSAKSPYEFALAARSAGVDSAVSEFARFSLQQTTSAQTYEALPRERISVSLKVSDEYVLLSPLVREGGWLDALPFEPREQKKKGEFKGLRGPVEDAIIKLTADPANPERWQTLMLILADAQARIDSNKTLRERCAALPWLDERWFSKAWPRPPAEIQVARAVASIGAGTEMPIVVNIFGVELARPGKLRFPKQRPQRAVWHTGDPVRLFAEILHRRLIDAHATAEVPLQARCPCSPEVVELLLEGTLDWDLIARWVPPLSLIDWQRSMPPRSVQRKTPASGNYLLAALFRPFFQPDFIASRSPESSSERQKPSGLFARRLLNLIRYGEWEEALQAARSRYRAWKIPVFVPSRASAASDLLVASLLVPLPLRDVHYDLERWLIPGKTA